MYTHNIFNMLRFNFIMFVKIFIYILFFNKTKTGIIHKEKNLSKLQL